MTTTTLNLEKQRSHPNTKSYILLDTLNTVNQLQLNYSTNVHLLIPRYMKSLCVITIKLNTLTDVPYQMTVGWAFVYVCERDRVIDFEQRSRVYNAVRYNTFTPPVDRVIMVSQCIT
mgnify:CR=1 FL=1